MKKMTSQLKAGAAISYFSIALNILAGLIYTPWMIRQIGQNQYGLFTLANSLISLFLLDFGLSSATSRYVAKLHARGDEEGVGNFLGVVYKLYLLIDLVILAVLIVVYFMLDRVYANLSAAELAQFKVVYVIAAAFSVIQFPFATFNGILTAYEQFIPLKLADVIYRILLIGMMIIALSLGYGLYALVFVYALSGILVIIYKFCIIQQKIKCRVRFRYRNQALYKHIFAFSLWSTVAALSQRLIFNITPSILGATAGAAATAVFGVVATIESYVYIVSNAINGMFIPRVAHIYTEENAEQKLQALLLKVGKYQYALEGLIIAGFAVLGKEFMHLWLGEAYTQAYLGVLLVIVPGLFFTSLHVANTAIVIKNEVRHYALVCFATGLINIVLSGTLSGRYGVIGACVSIAVAYTFRAVMLHILYPRILHFDLKKFIVGCYVKLSIPIFLTIFVGIWIAGIFPTNTWAGLLLCGIVQVSVYLLCLLLIERTHVMSVFRRKV